jgi:hypothetical protein
MEVGWITMILVITFILYVIMNSNNDSSSNTNIG